MESQFVRTSIAEFIKDPTYKFITVRTLANAEGTLFSVVIDREIVWTIGSLTHIRVLSVGEFDVFKIDGGGSISLFVAPPHAPTSKQSTPHHSSTKCSFIPP
jgi:hypothetical protein